jgi:hypothetical protein
MGMALHDYDLHHTIARAIFANYPPQGTATTSGDA